MCTASGLQMRMEARKMGNSPVPGSPGHSWRCPGDRGPRTQGTQGEGGLNRMRTPKTGETGLWCSGALGFQLSAAGGPEQWSAEVQATLPCLLHTMEQLLTQHNGLGATTTTTYTYTPFVGSQARRQKVGMA